MTRTIATAEESVRLWLDSFVVELNLCPFAKPALRSNGAKLISINGDLEYCLKSVALVCEQLDSDQSLETALIILESGCTHFDDYLDLVAISEALLIDLGYEGIYQIASFHPHYVFDGNTPTDLDNYTNRSPYPIIHLLRERSISQALATYPDAELIPDRNRETMLSKDEGDLKKRLENCY